MTLRTIGFEGPQVEAYMQLREQEGTEGRRLRMLEEKRGACWMTSIAGKTGCNSWTACATAFGSSWRPWASPAGRALQTIRRNWDEDPRQSRI